MWFAAGSPFFVGIALTVVLLLWLTKRQVKGAARRFGIIGVIVGVLFVAMSATPILPLTVLYLLWPFFIVRTLWRIPGDKAGSRFRQYYPLGIVVIISALMVGFEVPYRIAPRIEVGAAKDLYVIGDSLCGGAPTEQENWPELLGKALGLTTHNYSHGGATVRSAEHNAKRVEQAGALVIVWVGGNDMLKGAATKDYAAGLETILKHVCGNGRQVVMMELPLIPGFNGYGIAQRRLAEQYGITLLPKRLLADVLGTQGSTVDGLHFSTRGHALIAQSMLTVFSVQ